MEQTHWDIKDLAEVVFYQEGPGVRNNQYTNQGVKLLNVTNLQKGKIRLDNSDRYIAEEEAYGKYSHFLVDEGDLILASSGIKVEYLHEKMGFVYKEHLPLCMNTSTIRFKSLNKDVLDIRYFMYFLKSFLFKKQIGRLMTGSAQLNFGPSHLKQIHLPVPPLDVQQRIVKVLDKAQELIAKREEQIEACDELVKSLFYHMFGDPVRNSMKWDTKKLDECGTLERGKSKHRPRNDPALLNGPYPLIQTGDIAKSGLFIRQFKSTYSEIGLQQSKLWPAGTLCITIAANIAKTGILTFDACFPDSVVGFIENENTNKMFIQIWMSFLQKILEETAPESAQKNINLGILGDLIVICPTIELQNRFAEQVEKIEQQKQRLQQSLIKLENNFNALIQRAFKGELS